MRCGKENILPGSCRRCHARTLAPGFGRVRLLHFPVIYEGVWRRKAIDTAGGWNSRTTVEDMDLSLRAYLAGWKAIYLRHVTVLNEVCGLLSRASPPFRTCHDRPC